MTKLTIGTPEYRAALRRWTQLRNGLITRGLTVREEQEYRVLDSQLAAAELRNNLTKAKERGKP